MNRSLLAAAATFAFVGGLSAAPSAKVRVALIVESTVDDKGWCQAMHDAIKTTQKKYGNTLVEYSYSEKMKPVDAGSAARQYASKGFEIIICHGAQYKNLVLEMAEEFPKTSFAFGTSADIGPKNVFTYMPESEQTGYLNGIIAGMVTKANVIGNVGPVDGGDSARYNRGFYLGIKSVNPKADVKLAYTGSFGDFVKAAELAHTDIKAGADVLTGRFPAGDGRPAGRGRVQGQAHLVGGPGHQPAVHARELQGHRRRQLRLHGRGGGDHRQARSQGPGRGEPPPQLRQRRLRLQVQRQGRRRAHACRPQGRGCRPEGHEGRQAAHRLEGSEVLVPAVPFV